MSIRNAADTVAQHARKMKAAVEAKNECELVVLLAEAGIGAELKATQERGEVANRDDNLRADLEVPSENIGKATLSEIGLALQAGDGSQSPHRRRVTRRPRRAFEEGCSGTARGRVALPAAWQTSCVMSLRSV